MQPAGVGGALCARTHRRPAGKLPGGHLVTGGKPPAVLLRALPAHQREGDAGMGSGSAHRGRCPDDLLAITNHFFHFATLKRRCKRIPLETKAFPYDSRITFEALPPCISAILRAHLEARTAPDAAHSCPASKRIPPIAVSRLTAATASVHWRKTLRFSALRSLHRHLVANGSVRPRTG
jgi:hypothetical protein